MIIDKNSKLDNNFIEYFDLIPLYYRKEHTKEELKKFIEDYNLWNISLGEFIELTQNKKTSFLKFNIKDVDNYQYEDLLLRLDRIKELEFENNKLIRMNSTHFEYNEKNQLITTKIKRDVFLEIEFKYAYDEDNELINIKNCLANNNILFEYNENNKKIKTQIYNLKDNELIKEFLYHYENNKLEKKEEIHHLFKCVIEYYYNENEQIIYERAINKNNIEEYLFSFNYNEKNQLIEKKIQFINEKEYSFIYEYDNKDNLIYFSNKSTAYKVSYNNLNEIKYVFFSRNKIDFDLIYEYKYNENNKLENIIDYYSNEMSIIDFKNNLSIIVKDYEYEKDIDDFFSFEESLELDKK